MYYAAGYGYLLYLCCGTPIFALTGLLICKLLILGAETPPKPAKMIVPGAVLMVLLCCILMFIVPIIL